MRVPTVCSSPTGNLWLLLREREGGSRWLNLETAEVRDMQTIRYLLTWGWRVVEGDLE